MGIEHRLNDEYFNWMYQLVCNDKYNENLSYRRLLHYLHTIDFYYLIDMDENRADDGIQFRYRFGYEMDYPREDIARYVDTRPCSVLEMIMALAFAVEEDIMDDPTYGDRTGQWFWDMMVSLGLGGMNDKKFDFRYVEDVIYRFLDRKYERNGEGGLFTISNPPYDMRTAEIWHQAMWYLDDILS